MPKSLTEISDNFNLPIAFLARMKKNGLIGSVVEDVEIPWFVLLSQIWGRSEYLRMQLDCMPEKDLKALLKPKPLPQVDRYILARYRNARPGEKISVDDLAYELKQKFGVKLSEKLREKIKKLRYRVREEKRPQKEGK